MSVLDEARAGGPDEEDFLQEVEGDVRGGEELAGVGGGEADVGDGVVWQVVGAEGKELGLQTGKSAWCWRDLRWMGEHTAQQPRTTRLFHGLRGFGGMDSMVSAIRRITVSASLSS